jgi:hypothetical protein
MRMQPSRLTWLRYFVESIEDCFNPSFCEHTATSVFQQYYCTPLSRTQPTHRWWCNHQLSFRSREENGARIQHLYPKWVIYRILQILDSRTTVVARSSAPVPSTSKPTIAITGNSIQRYNIISNSISPPVRLQTSAAVFGPYNLLQNSTTFWELRAPNCCPGQAMMLVETGGARTGTPPRGSRWLTAA